MSNKPNEDFKKLKKYCFKQAKEIVNLLEKHDLSNKLLPCYYMYKKESHRRYFGHINTFKNKIEDNKIIYDTFAFFIKTDKDSILEFANLLKNGYKEEIQSYVDSHSEINQISALCNELLIVKKPLKFKWINLLKVYFLKIAT